MLFNKILMDIMFLLQIDDVGIDTMMFLGQIGDVCMGAIYIILLYIENMYT